MRKLGWNKRNKLDMWRTAGDGRVTAVVDGYKTAEGPRYRASVVVFFAVEEQSMPGGGVVEEERVRTVPLSQDGFRTLVQAQEWAECWSDNAEDMMPPR